MCMTFRMLTFGDIKAGTDVNMGFPIAAIEADGTFNIEKEKNTGGCVTVGSVASQLLYEIQGPYVKTCPCANLKSLTNIQTVL